MQRGRYGLLAFGLVLAVTVPARADDSAVARALVDKAVQAHGGKTQLTRFPAVTSRVKGTFHGLGEAAGFTGELATDGPKRLKFVVETVVGDQKVRFVNVLNGTRGWFQFNDKTEELNDKDLAEAREEAYSQWVASLVPLKAKAFLLETVGEVTIASRPALGVKVSSKGHRDVKLYFDKETNLLVKTETQVQDEGNPEVTEATFLSNYQEVQGTRQAMTITIKRDGKPYLECKVTQCQLAERLDDRVFARPTP